MKYKICILVLKFQAWKEMPTTIKINFLVKQLNFLKSVEAKTQLSVQSYASSIQINTLIKAWNEITSFTPPECNYAFAKLF